jgi:hypothetical protein
MRDGENVAPLSHRSCPLPLDDDPDQVLVDIVKLEDNAVQQLGIRIVLLRDQMPCFSSRPVPPAGRS